MAPLISTEMCSVLMTTISISPSKTPHECFSTLID